MQAQQTAATTASTLERMAINTDVVGITPGMPLDKAQAAVAEHLNNPAHFQLRREFSTKPNYLQNADLYVAESSNEYLVLFHEPSDEPSVVLGVIRSLRLPSGKLSRSKTIKLLRKKYGQENFLDAQRELHMLWGHEVSKAQRASTPEIMVLNRECSVGWNSHFPRNLADKDGNSFNARQSFDKAQAPFLAWPTLGNHLNFESCGQYLSARHMQDKHDMLHVAAFDLALLRRSLDTLQNKGEDIHLDDEEIADDDDLDLKL